MPLCGASAFITTRGIPVFRSVCRKIAAAVGMAICFSPVTRQVYAADAALAISPRLIGELKPTAIIHLGKTADWVAITPDAVWVGSTGPFAVNKIDPNTNTRIASVKLD